jgi:hypothetical protein
MTNVEGQMSSERSEAESKDPVELPFVLATGFLDFTPNDGERFVIWISSFGAE